MRPSSHAHQAAQLCPRSSVMTERAPEAFEHVSVWRTESEQRISALYTDLPMVPRVDFFDDDVFSALEGLR